MSVRLREVPAEAGRAARSLVRRPGLTVATVVVLGIGLGAVTALFGAARVLLLDPLPFPHPDELVAVRGVDEAGERTRVSLPDLLDVEASATSLEAVGVVRRRSFALDGGAAATGAPRIVQVGMASAGFLDALGVDPLLGRSFTPEEDTTGAAVVLLGEPLWRALGADRDILGTTVRLNEVPHGVVGVLGREGAFPLDGRRLEAFIPLDRRTYGNRGARGLVAVGRLGEGSSVARATEELGVVAARLAEDHPNSNRGRSLTAEPLDEVLRGSRRAPLLALAAAALLLLVVACFNAASLRLADFLERRREAAIRASLGARTGHLVGRQVLEALLLAAAAGLLGLGVAAAILAAVPVALPLLGAAAPVAGVDLEGLGLLGGAGTGLAVGALGFVLVTVIGLGLGLAPALLARRLDLQGALQAAGGRGSGARSRLRSVLVVGQVALSVVLLLGAALLLHSLWNVATTDPGFRTDDVWRFGIGLPTARYDSEEALIAFHRRLVEELEALPAVGAAGPAARMPLGGASYRTGFTLEGGDGEPRGAAINVVGPGWFRALGVPLLAGRLPGPRDTVEAPRVVVVNRAFVRTHLVSGSAASGPADDPLAAAVGRRLSLSWFSALTPAGTPWRIVGVVGDVRQESLDREPTPEIYLPASQFPLDGASYALRLDSAMPDLGRRLQELVWELDPDLQEVEVRPLERAVHESLGERRTAAVLLAALAAIALLLTAVGLYGVTVAAVAARRHEMAVRLVLGARPRAVAGAVIARALGLGGLGLVLGLVLHPAVSRLVESRLHGVGASDPTTILAVVLVLALALALAALPAARRAARTPPMEALRR